MFLVHRLEYTNWISNLLLCVVISYILYSRKFSLGLSFMDDQCFTSIKYNRAYINHQKSDLLKISCYNGIHIGMFYYTLGNIRPELRSTHCAIQLFACVTSPYLEKYGFVAPLYPRCKYP